MLTEELFQVVVSLQPDPKLYEEDSPSSETEKYDHESHMAWNQEQL
jgi:hypothetical protein